MSKKQPNNKKKVQKSSKQATLTTHKKKSEFLKVYWPYIPLFILVFIGMTFGYNWQNGARITSSYQTGVMAYSTSMSASGLLSATNTQRAQNGNIPALALNSKLSAAAQAKANDMVARDYWSHTTPDGKEPWVFIDEAGYTYQKAGENLAYGFANSNETVIGWMNSQSHRENMLDPSYKDVGFGYANSASYVGTGEETIVVAMYATPPGATATPATPAAPAAAPTAPAAQPAAPSTPAPTATIPTPTQQDTAVATEEKKNDVKKVPDDRYNEAVTSENELPSAQPTTRITKLQTITSGYAPWSASVLSGLLVLVVGMWVIKHAFVLKKVLLDGEQFALHHPLLDVAVLVIVCAAVYLSQSSGVVK